MGHSLNRTSFRINQNLIIDDVTFEPDYILISDVNGNVSWKNPSTYITQEEPLDHFIGELYGGGVVVAVWREQREQLYEKTLIASVKDFGVVSGFGGRGEEDFLFTDFTWSWSGVTNSLIGATAQYHSFGASNSLSIISQDPSGVGAAAKCLGYTNEDLYGLGVYGDWYLPSTFEINCLANNSAIVNRVIAKYAADKSIRLVDENVYVPPAFPWDFGYNIFSGASMSLFLNTSPGYWTSTEFNRGSAYYLDMNSNGVIFATASKSNALLNVRPFRQDVKRWNGITWVPDRKKTGQVLITYDRLFANSIGSLTIENVSNITNVETSFGNTVIVASYSTLPVDLSQYDHIWDIGLEDNSNQLLLPTTKYETYLQQGGGIFLLGERMPFTVRNNDIASFITSLGGGTVTASSDDVTALLDVDSEFLIANNTNTMTFVGTSGRLSSIGTGTPITRNPNPPYPGAETGSAVVWKTGSLSQALKGAIVVVLDINWLTNGYFNLGNSQQFLANISQILNKS